MTDSIVASSTDNPSLGRRQARCVSLLSITTIIVLFSLGAVLLWYPRLLMSDDPDSAVCQAPDLRLAGGVLEAQAISSLLLLLPILRDCLGVKGIREIAMHMSRAALVGTSITSLILILMSLWKTEDWNQQRILIVGTILLTLSCLSLMVSFWPASSVDIETQTTDDDAPEDEPLLRQAVNGGAQEDYQLIGDDEEELPVEEEQLDNQNTTTDRIRGTRRLLQLAAPQVLYLYAGCTVLLIRLPFSLSIPHFVSTTLSALAHADFAKAHHEIILLFLMGSIDAVLDFWCVFLFGYANQRIVRGVRLDLFAQILRQEIAFFDTHSSGELSSRLNSDCSEMAGDLTWFFRFSIESIVRITGITAYMLIRSPILGACALSIVPVVGVINKLYGDWLRRNATAVQDALAEANKVAQEALGNIRTVIAFAAEQEESQRYDARIQRQYRLNIRQLYMTGVYYMAVSTFLINTVVQTALLWIGSELIAHEKLTAEVLLAFMLYQGQLQNETLNLFQSYSSLIKSSGAGDKVFALLDRSPPQPSTGSALVQTQHTESSELDHPQRNQYDVRLKQVTFRYPSRPHHIVLHHLDLEIPKGKTVALVGSSGCGKTTILNLLQRFYDPDQGVVEIDGTDLRQLDLLNHRRNIGVVTQDPTLFDGTILENITYGSPNVTREEAARAAKLANAHPFIRHFPDGYNTAVGERGVQLSGGQKQRIAIARAIVKNPALLLLDEATSSLDAESEQVVQEALDKLLETNSDMTTVIIAHRLRTVRNADYIAVLDKGRVVEWGAHAELLQLRSGLYRKMVGRAGNSGVLPEKLSPDPKMLKVESKD